MNKSPDLNAPVLGSCFASPFRTIRKNEIQNYPVGVSYIGGIYDESDKPHTDSLLKRASEIKQTHDVALVINRTTAKKITSQAIYGGVIFNHYGHFLLESLARTWYLQKSSSDVFFYHPQGNKFSTFNDLSTWQKIILGHLIPDTGRIKIINEPLVFNELIVPDAGYVIKQFCADSQAKAMSSLGAKITAKYDQDIIEKKIWLSRSSLTKGSIAGEKKFEGALRDEGFKVVHPETLSIAEQIKLFETAEVVSGFTGSAFHTVLLAKSNGGKLLHFCREQHLNKNYKLCAEAAKFDAEFYNYFLRFGKIRGVNGNALQDLSKIWNIFYQQGLVQTEKYSDPEMEDNLELLDMQLKNRAPHLFGK